MHVGIVDFTADGLPADGNLSGDVAWRSRWTELDTWLRAAPVDAVVFHVDLDDHPELMRALGRVKEANGKAKLVLAAMSRNGTLTAEITSITVHTAVERQVPLSRREMEVLGAIRSGRTNREIAAMLGISLSTANKHVENILHKLSARNRAQAAAGLPPPPYTVQSGNGGNGVYTIDRGRKPRTVAAHG